MPLDPMLHAYRQDVADIALAGQVIASHYAEPLLRVSAVVTQLMDADRQPIGTIAAGAQFAVLDCNRGLAWGYTVEGHRVGYVDLDALA